MRLLIRHYQPLVIVLRWDVRGVRTAIGTLVGSIARSRWNSRAADSTSTHKDGKMLELRCGEKIFAGGASVSCGRGRRLLQNVATLLGLELGVGITEHWKSSTFWHTGVKEITSLADLNKMPWRCIKRPLRTLRTTEADFN
ncbi:hypothetical protein PF006_g15830 [Phytophthora fragariae]|nr:hypothetical protein PF011_g15551 [Phytophthora fragariae]KAE9130151.1 hypothetical protein PF006_g15830 [Phytophthora fragariae]KAE9336840.1 hypothetical protein PF008_g12830 [Phytophthora fragariae]